MDPFPPEIRDISERLLALEAASGKRGEGTATSRVIEKLRRQLSTLAGVAGFHSLLARALSLAKEQDPGLNTLMTKEDASIDGLDKLGDHVDKDDGGVILISQILGLLHTFLGKDLTMRIVQDAWLGEGRNGIFNHHSSKTGNGPAKRVGEGDRIP